MLVLLDENLLSAKLKKPLINAGHSVKNVNDMGWRGVKDRELLRLADAYPFDVFITADKNLPYQQQIQELQLRIVVLNSRSTRPDYLLPLIAKISESLESLPRVSITLINENGEISPF